MLACMGYALVGGIGDWRCIQIRQNMRWYCVLQGGVQGVGKVHDRGETILRGFCQGFEDDLLYLGRHVRADAPQGWRCILLMV